MKIILFPAAILFLLLSSCGGNTEETPPQAAVDKVTLTYYADVQKGSAGEATSVTLTDAEQAVLLTSLLEGEPTEEFKCGYHGKVSFYVKDSLLYEGEFNLSSDCRHFAYMKDGKLMSVKLDEREVTTLQQYRMKAYENQLAELKWFLGKWQYQEQGALSTEKWVQTGPAEYLAHGYTLKGKDTVFQEHIRLIAADSGVFYIPNVGAQGPVPFRLTHYDKQFVSFENPAHDFPNKITYELVGIGSLVAKIYGVYDNGKPGHVAYFFEKAE